MLTVSAGDPLAAQLNDVADVKRWGYCHARILHRATPTHWVHAWHRLCAVCLCGVCLCGVYYQQPYAQAAALNGLVCCLMIHWIVQRRRVLPAVLRDIKTWYTYYKAPQINKFGYGGQPVNKAVCWFPMAADGRSCYSHFCWHAHEIQCIYEAPSRERHLHCISTSAAAAGCVFDAESRLRREEDERVLEGTGDRGSEEHGGQGPGAKVTASQRNQVRHAISTQNHEILGIDLK